MNNKIETNILVIGKSGVGKSSLINYIFDEPIMKTGTGKPVTEKGIFTNKLHVSDNFIVNLSDTWGLEANKAPEWKGLIEGVVKENDAKSISEWFHTIFFCFSAKSARIEDFEKEIIKNLINEGNNIIVILTHCDTNNVAQSIIEMSKELNKVGIKNENIIKVCNIEKKLLGGKITQPFGKEEILNSIKINLWLTICNKLPNIIDEIIDRGLNSWYNKSVEYAENNITWFNSQSNKKLEEISEKIKSLLNNELINLSIRIENKYKEAEVFYTTLIKNYNFVNLNKDYYTTSTISLDFTLDFQDKLVENIGFYILSFIPLAIFFIPSVNKSHRIETIQNRLDSVKINISKDLKIKNKIEIDKMKRMVVQ